MIKITIEDTDCDTFVQQSAESPKHFGNTLKQVLMAYVELSSNCFGMSNTVIGLMRGSDDELLAVLGEILKIYDRDLEFHHKLSLADCEIGIRSFLRYIQEKFPDVENRADILRQSFD